MASTRRERDRLLAARFDIEGMRREIGVDSLAFISADGLYRAMGLSGRDPDAPAYCDACFTVCTRPRLTDHDDGSVSKQLSLLEEVV